VKALDSPGLYFALAAAAAIWALVDAAVSR